MNPAASAPPVSYTHLDVYKRQAPAKPVYPAANTVVKNQNPDISISLARCSPEKSAVIK